jgi:hypothetical protein
MRKTVTALVVVLTIVGTDGLSAIGMSSLSRRPTQPPTVTRAEDDPGAVPSGWIGPNN